MKVSVCQIIYCKKECHHFARKPANTTSSIPAKICKSLPEKLTKFCKVTLSLSFRWKSRTTPHPKERDVFLKKHLIYPVSYRFLQSSFFSLLRLHYAGQTQFLGKATPKNIFYIEQVQGLLSLFFMTYHFWIVACKKSQTTKEVMHFFDDKSRIRLGCRSY